MCGRLRTCSTSGRVAAPTPALQGEGEHSGFDEVHSNPNVSDNADGDEGNATVHIIPRQNKGVCTACDVTVWLLLTSESDQGSKLVPSSSAKRHKPKAAKGTGKFSCLAEAGETSKMPLAQHRTSLSCNASATSTSFTLRQGLEIKWCKGCKNFRPWVSFGEKGQATKCVRCRMRQKEKYQSQKQDGSPISTRKGQSRHEPDSGSTDYDRQESLQHCDSMGEDDRLAALGLKTLMQAAFS
jgi:hypothetical protein